jgi:hypothetical protein
MGFKALYVAAQIRKRACACAVHTRRSSKYPDRFPIQKREPEANPFVHDMF